VAGDDGVLGWQWHQLYHMQTICTLLQTDSHASTHHTIFTGRMLFLMPNQQCQSTEGLKPYTELFLSYQHVTHTQTGREMDIIVLNAPRCGAVMA